MEQGPETRHTPAVIGSLTSIGPPPAPRAWIGLMISLCVFGLCIACGPSPATRGEGVPVVSEGDRRPIDLELAQLDGQSVSLTRYRGKVVLVLYFATWCAPCAELFPVLDALDSGPNAVRDLEVLGVSVDLNARELLPHFLEYMRTGFPVVLADQATLDGKTPFGQLPAIPTAYLVDARGRHVETYLGVVPVERLRQRVAALQAEGENQ